MSEDYKSMASEIVTAYISKNPLEPEEVTKLLQSLIETLSMEVSTKVPEPKPTQVDPKPAKPQPAVPIDKSIQDDYLICLEDGVKVKMLKRYLKTHFNMTPQDYIRKWALPHDYPMVSPAYSETRRDIARRHGLGFRD